MSDTTNQANSPADRRARKWRTLILLAGFALASSFFMPAVQGCNTPVVPAKVALEVVQTGPSLWPPTLAGWREFGAGFAFCIAAYPFGLLAAVFAVARIRRWRAWHVFFSIVLLVWLITVSILILLGLAAELIRSGLPTWADLMSAEGILVYSATLIIPLLVLAYLVTALRLRDRRHLCWMLAGSCWATAWFGYWVTGSIIDGGGYYGVYVSFTAACFLAIATLGEAVALTRQSWLRTAGQLLTCRLAAFPKWEGRCPGCDYYLYGLTEMRCPECGRAFSFEEIGATREAMGFGRVDSA
jgi:hypothetical protein